MDGWLCWLVSGAAAPGAHPLISVAAARVIMNTLIDLVLGIIFCFEFDSILKLRRFGTFHVL